MRLDILKAMNAARRERRAGAVVTRLADGDQRFVGADALGADALAGEIEAALRMGKSGVVTVAGIDYFVTVQAPAPRLTLVGAVHISQALAPIARIAGLDVTIVDPRTAFATPERFPETPVLAQWPDEALAARPLDRFTAICLLTHDPKIDDPALTIALRAECFYIGALGSRKTHAKRLERMRAAGFRRDDARAHPRPDRPRHRRRQSGRNRGVDHGRDRRFAAQEAAALGKRRGMKFGEVPLDEAEGAIVAHARAGQGRHAEEGRCDHARAPAHAGGRGRRRASSRRVSKRATSARTRRRGRWQSVSPAPMCVRAAAFTGRVNLFAEATGLAVVDAAAIDTDQRDRRVDHGRDAAELPTGDGRRHDRDRQDHPLRDARCDAHGRVCGARRRQRCFRRAVPAPASSASSRPCCRGSR